MMQIHINFKLCCYLLHSKGPEVESYYFIGIYYFYAKDEGKRKYFVSRNKKTCGYFFIAFTVYQTFIICASAVIIMDCCFLQLHRQQPTSVCTWKNSYCKSDFHEAAVKYSLADAVF